MALCTQVSLFTRHRSYHLHVVYTWVVLFTCVTLFMHVSCLRTQCLHVWCFFFWSTCFWSICYFLHMCNCLHTWYCLHTCHTVYTHVAIFGIFFPRQKSERRSKCLTETATASSPNRSWAWPCVPWATCLTRWSWRSSSRDWTWMVRLPSQSS